MPESSRSNGELLIRIDERTKRMDAKLDDICRRNDKDHDEFKEHIRDLEKSGRIGTFADVGAYIVAAAAGVTAVLTGKR